METNFPLWVNTERRLLFLTPQPDCRCYICQTSELAVTAVRYLRSLGYHLTAQDAAALDAIKRRSPTAKETV